MSNILDPRATDVTLRLSTGVDSDVTVTLLGPDGEPLLGVTPSIHLGGPMASVEPLDDADASFAGTGGTLTGVWSVAVTGQDAGPQRLRISLDGVVVAVGLCEVGSTGTREPTTALTIAGGTATIALSVAAVVEGPGGGGSTAIPVSDDGSQVVEAVASFNFTGAGVTVTDDGDGAVEVAIPGRSLPVVAFMADPGGTPTDTLDIQVPYPIVPALTTTATVSAGDRVLALSVPAIIWEASASGDWTEVHEVTAGDVVVCTDASFGAGLFPYGDGADETFHGLAWLGQVDGSVEPNTDWQAMVTITSQVVEQAAPLTKNQDYLAGGGSIPGNFADGGTTNMPAQNGIMVAEGWGVDGDGIPGTATEGVTYILDAPTLSLRGVRCVLKRTADPADFPGPVILDAATNGATIDGADTLTLTDLNECVEVVLTQEPAGSWDWLVISHYVEGGGGGGGSAAWGDIGGTLSAQTDLQGALDAKVPTSRQLAGLDLTANRSASDMRGALGTGTPSASNFLRGDGTWSAASGSGWAPAEIMVPGHNLTSDIATSRRIGGSTARTRVALPQADTLTGGIAEVGFGVVPHLPWTSVDVWLEWFHLSSSTADVVWRLYMGGQTTSHTLQTSYQVTATGTGGSGNDLTYGRRERVKIATAVSVTDTDYNSFNIGRLGTDGADTMSGTVYLTAVGFRAAGT